MNFYDSVHHNIAWSKCSSVNKTNTWKHLVDNEFPCLGTKQVNAHQPHQEFSETKEKKHLPVFHDCGKMGICSCLDLHGDQYTLFPSIIFQCDDVLCTHRFSFTLEQINEFFPHQGMVQDAISASDRYNPGCKHIEVSIPCALLAMLVDIVDGHRDRLPSLYLMNEQEFYLPFAIGTPRQYLDSFIGIDLSLCDFVGEEETMYENDDDIELDRLSIHNRYDIANKLPNMCCRGCWKVAWECDCSDDFSVDE